MPYGLDYDALEYLNPAALSVCTLSSPATAAQDGYPLRSASCTGVFRGMWKAGVAYARGDVIYVCADYEEPTQENLWKALRTHCASEEDRPESGVNWRRTWQIRIRPGQPDHLDDLDEV